MIGGDYRMVLQRSEREPSWWRRVILRRRTRWLTIACQIPVGFSFNRGLNAPDSGLQCVVEGADAMELLERIQVAE